MIAVWNFIGRDHYTQPNLVNYETQVPSQAMSSHQDPTVPQTVEQMNAKMDHIEKVIEEKKPLLEAAQKLVAEEKALEQERVDAMGDDERGAWDASEAARIYLEESEKARKEAEQAEAERWASLTESERQAEEKEKRRLAAIAAEEEEERRLQQEEDDEW